jgi:hypothetical protein
MKTSLQQLKQILRGLVLTATLATTTVGMHTQTANAEERNPCRDYFNQLAQERLQAASLWLAWADVLADFPDGLSGPWTVDMAADARMQARMNYRGAESYEELARTGCQ